MQSFDPSDIPDKLARWLPTGSTLALLGDDVLDDAENATLLSGYGASLGKIERRWFEDLYEFF